MIASSSILLVMPPVSMPNTPYPSVPLLAGYLRKQGYTANCCDLGLELFLNLFTSSSLRYLFSLVEMPENSSKNAQTIYKQREKYIQCIDAVMLFLKNGDSAYNESFNAESYFPKAKRIDSSSSLTSFIRKGDKQSLARFKASLMLEDLADFIAETIDPHFAIGRYAESLGLSIPSFSLIEDELKKESPIDRFYLSSLEKKIAETNPQLVCFSIPFPGNLLGAFKCAAWIKTHFPAIKIAMGGGFVNTELRQLSDIDVFKYTDFISFDDGELPLVQIIRYLSGKIAQNELIRTAVLDNNSIKFIQFENSPSTILPHSESFAPDYSDLSPDGYLSLFDTPNPVQRLWSEGNWLKLALAHGCYWAKCAFCDTSLDYIGRYHAAPVKVIADKMQELQQQTGLSGFHFVDEAAPPAILRDLALEILQRNMKVSWWANIRFEKTFTPEMCRLLAASGCIAVTGGLEVASDRLLSLMNKGVTIKQAALACKAFRDAGILVHAYLMYDFPTQTEQEIIDSLEVVRQLFAEKLLQSAYWHRFALTLHSPVGKCPDKYLVEITQPLASFANNGVTYKRTSVPLDASLYSFGLQKSLYNFMLGLGIDKPVNSWFLNKTPRTSLSASYIKTFVANAENAWQNKKQLVYVGKPLMVLNPETATCELLTDYLADVECENVYYVPDIQKVHKMCIIPQSVALQLQTISQTPYKTYSTEEFSSLINFCASDVHACKALISAGLILL